MTHEDKQLLLKDLCARLPYGLKLRYVEDLVTRKESHVITLNNIYLEHILNGDADIKPYLRPMSSMTPDEREEVEIFIFNKWYEEDSCKIDNEGWIEILANYDVSGIDPGFCGDYVDWLNAHHFDYRGLIEKGLALEAPEGMYKTE